MGASSTVEQAAARSWRKRQQASASSAAVPSDARRAREARPAAERKRGRLVALVPALVLGAMGAVAFAEALTRSGNLAQVAAAVAAGALGWLAAARGTSGRRSSWMAIGLAGGLWALGVLLPRGATPVTVGLMQTVATGLVLVAILLVLPHRGLARVGVVLDVVVLLVALQLSSLVVFSWGSSPAPLAEGAEGFGLYWSVVGGGLGYVALVAGRHGLARRSSWAVPVLWGAWCLALASLFQARPLPLIGPVQHALAAALHVGGWGLVGVAALASLRGVGGQGGPEGAVRESRLPMLSAGVAGVTVLLTAELVLRLRAGVPAQWYVGPVLLLGLVVARQFLTLVENRQLIRRLVAAKRAEAELREVGLALGSNLEFDRVLETICQIAQRLVGADVVFCWLLDDAGGALELRAATGGRAGEFIGRRCTLADGEALAVRVLLEARPRVVGWRAGGERPNPFYSLVLGIRTWLAVPLTLGGKVFGVLECGSGSPRDLGLEEVAKVELLAAQAVVALENAHLYEQAQRRLRVALALSDLLASTQRARNQVDVGRALLEVLDLRLGFDRGAVYLVEGARRLTSAVTGAFDPVLGRCHVSEHEKVEADGFIEATAWNGRPSRWWSEHAPIPTARLAVPLWMRDQVVGVVAVERSGRPYTSGDERLALALAHQAALVLENLTLSAEAQQVEALRELHRIKSDLFSMLSHDLRAPLSTVKSYAEALREDEGLLSPEERREYLGVIREESDRLLELVGDLLDLSRMEAGVLRVEPEPVPLARVVEEMVRWARGQARGHQIEVDVPPDLLVEADPRRLRQVLRNLLENAIKYSPSGGRVRVHAAVRCGAAPERGRSGGGVAADEVVISVSDEGMGIPRHLQEQIFQPFRRVPGRGTSRIDGAGLGLAICKGLVEAQDGRIWVESEIGRGSTFFFTLPLCRVSDEEPGEGVE